MSFLISAGPLVWPVIVLAVAAVFAASLFSRNSQRSTLVWALGTWMSCFVLSLLNLVLGFQRAVGPLGQLDAERRFIYLIGISESLNGVVIALIAALVLCVLLTAGLLRGREQTKLVSASVG